MTQIDNELRDAIARVLNEHSRENRSDTPDFVLAEYVLDALDAFDRAVRMREGWYGRDVGGGIQVADYVGSPPLHLVPNEPAESLDPPIPVDQLKFIAEVRDEEPPVDEDRTPERHFDWDENTTLGTAFGEAVGLASMCWTPTPTGLFNDQLAGDIVNELLWFLTKREQDGVGLPRIVYGDPDDRSTWVDSGKGDHQHGTLVIPPELEEQHVDRG